ncbi:coiled-coil domain-containing protein 124 [Macrosteles quadrilineatus]|uniref:coiled-coil domain-containing protein 124 n=1 Tax=Macrosteles quadrilineatus TaxID=74068 RepID=UPI0023E19917|nr:coiled-coil domain-containing protein 124 [Macrosteles quadrilineatus]XP_054277723.1 coiled-coil domain-containing protein 124 [Macrosteles quadrilineatus]XP_054277724.1 coiled-coil domain-containing protein 124 [Macrosteles quadrilineatus]
MPKKFVGENSKAVAAKARKAAAEEEKAALKQKQLEDEYWKDDDKSLAKKQARKEEQEKRKLEQLKKKQEAKQIIEEEVNSIKIGGKQPAAKITRAQITAEAERRNQAATGKPKAVETHLDQPLEENINRMTLEGEEARTVDEAINLLSSKDVDVDKHPEKRMKAAFTAFEEVNMPRIKQENPTLRLSQLKQILRKEWMKSPENPLNQRLQSA